MDTQAITLDCSPGAARPGDLINGVLEGLTDLTGQLSEPSTFFGAWTWFFEMSDDDWEELIKPVIAPRIEGLYREGWIRYGSWG